MLSIFKRCFFKKLFVVAIVFSLIGCSRTGSKYWFRDRTNDYLYDKTVPRLIIPKNLNYQIDKDAQIFSPPDQKTTTNVKLNKNKSYVLKRPDYLSQVPDTVKHKVVDGKRPYLLMDSSYDVVFLKFKQFLKNLQIPVAIADYKQGKIETQWFNFYDHIKNKKQGDMLQFDLKDNNITQSVKDKLYITIEKKSGFYGVKLMIEDHRQLNKEKVLLNNESDRAHRINQYFLKNYSLYLYSKEKNKNQISFLNKAITKNSLSIVSINNNPTLKIEEVAFSQVWSSIEEILKKSKVTLVKQDRTTGVFSILSNDSSKSDTSLNKQKNEGLLVNRVAKKEEKKLKTLTAYLLRVSRVTGSIYVTLETDADTYAPVEYSKSFLSYIKQNIR